MPEIFQIRHDADSLSPLARKVLSAALEVANSNPDINDHCVELTAFCSLAGLQSGTTPEVAFTLLEEARKTLIEFRVIDTENPQAETLWGSTPILGEVYVADAQVCFSLICPGFSKGETLMSLSKGLLIPDAM